MECRRHYLEKQAEAENARLRAALERAAEAVHAEYRMADCTPDQHAHICDVCRAALEPPR